MACNILQKQLENINGQKENIIIPSVAMQRIRDRQRSGIDVRLKITRRRCLIMFRKYTTECSNAEDTTNKSVRLLLKEKEVFSMYSMWPSNYMCIMQLYLLCMSYLSPKNRGFRTST